MFEGRLRAVVAAAFLAAVPAAAIAAQPAPPLEAYGRLPAIERVALSPDGQRIAFVGTVSGKRVLAVRSVKGELIGGVDVGDRKVRDLAWADPRHVLITTSVTTELENLPGGVYFLRGEFFSVQSYDVDKKRFVVLLEGGARESYGSRISGGSTWLNVTTGAPDVRMVDGAPVVYVGGYDKDYLPTLFKVDPASGKGVPVKGGFGVLDQNGQVVATEEYDDEARRWRLLAREGAGWRELQVIDGADIDTPSVMGGGRAPGTILLSVPGENRTSLYEVSLADGKRKKLGFGDLGDGWPVYNPWNGALIGFSFVKGAGYEYVFTDPTVDGIWAAVRAGFKDKQVELLSWTPDFKKVLVKTQGDRDPGTLMMVDATTRTAARLGSDYPDVPATAVAEQRWVTYKAADGLDIPAYLTLPPGREAKNLPLIVLPHGGPHARDEPGFDWWAQALASRGYAVLQPQFRGSDGFGAAFMAAGFGEYGRKMQTDLSDGVRWLAKEEIADPDRVCIAGASYGGYAALAGATLDRGVYRCASSVAGVADVDWKMDNMKHRAGRRDTVGDRFWTRYMGPRETWSQINPIQHVDKADAPIQLIHGRDDTVVPIQHSWRFRDAMKRVGKSVEFVELPGEDHWLSGGDTRLAMLQAQIAFLEKHNPPN